MRKFSHKTDLVVEIVTLMVNALHNLSYRQSENTMQLLQFVKSVLQLNQALFF